MLASHTPTRIQISQHRNMRISQVCHSSPRLQVSKAHRHKTHLRNVPTLALCHLLSVDLLPHTNSTSTPYPLHLRNWLKISNQHLHQRTSKISTANPPSVDRPQPNMPLIPPQTVLRASDPTPWRLRACRNNRMATANNPLPHQPHPPTQCILPCNPRDSLHRPLASCCLRHRSNINHNRTSNPKLHSNSVTAATITLQRNNPKPTP